MSTVLAFPVYCIKSQFSSGQSLSRVRLFATPWIAARQASLSLTNSQSSLRLTSIPPPKQEKEYVKAAYCHPAFLTYMQSTSWEMPG